MKVKPDTVIIVGGITILGIVLYKLFSKAADTVKTGYNDARNWTADVFYRWLGPDEAFGPDLYYNVGFEDGTRHAIASTLVNPQTFVFPYGGTSYRMFLGKDNKRYAMRVS